MNGNSITGLPNPVDRDATANKNYADNGGAIAKNPDGSFTEVSDIDFICYKLKNLFNPRDDRDAVNKAYVDKKNISSFTHRSKAYYNCVGRRKRTIS